MNVIQARVPQLGDLQGLWQRSLISWPDGARDTTTNVRWLQGFCAYVDLRQPPVLGDFSHLRGLADLTLDDCARLAVQQGFAGHLSFDGIHFEWSRSIDFQPKAPHADAGSLWWESGVLIEKGRDIDYVEHWRRDESATVRPAASIALVEKNSGTGGRLLRVGPWFMYARDRAVTLPQHTTLSECVSAAPTLSHAQTLLDCEISFGSVTPKGLLITASSLPFRVGDLLGQHLGSDTLTTTDRDPDGGTHMRRWDITEREGELSALQ
jgi:hypothetical protein